MFKIRDIDPTLFHIQRLKILCETILCTNNFNS